MSESKFVMAKKLYNIQKALMDMSIQDMSLDALITLIFQVLVNAFNLTESSVSLEDNENSSALQEEENTEQNTTVISGDKITPKPIREAISKIQAKGVEVNKKSIRAHVPWSQLSTDQRIKCTNYLEDMEASA